MTTSMKDISFEIVTSTEFTEYSENVYAAMIDQIYFVLEIIAEERSLRLSSGFSEFTGESRKALINSLLSSLHIREDQIIFSEHSIRIQFFLRKDWLEKLQLAIKNITGWSKNYHVMSGCFMCGIDDATVFFQNIEGKNIFICDNCKISSEQNKIIKRIEDQHAEFINSKTENLKHGFFFTLAARTAMSVLWIPPVVTLFINAFHDWRVDAAYWNVFTITFFVMFISAFLFIGVYKKAAGNITLRGYLLVALVLVLSSVVEIWIYVPIVYHSVFGTFNLESMSGPVDLFSLPNLYQDRILPGMFRSVIFITPFCAIISALLLYFAKSKFTTEFADSLKPEPKNK